MVEAAVNRMVPQPTHRLAWMIAEFRRHRILYDYLDDGRLLFRLNQVMRRVGLAPLPPEFAALLPRPRTRCPAQGRTAGRDTRGVDFRSQISDFRLNTRGRGRGASVVGLEYRRCPESLYPQPSIRSHPCHPWLCHAACKSEI